MTDFGIITFSTEYSLQPDELARGTEERGFESLFFAEHTHIPTSRKTPYPAGGDLPREYWHPHDLFVALTAAAMVTSTLKIGSGICLIPEHEPLSLAKSIASLDMLSGGRVVLGIGAGWNAEELQNHGIAFKDRWKVTRERVLAMRRIWTEDEPEFHGDFVDFDPIWSYPKPVTPGGPPILLGAGSRWSYDRVVEYCDGWMPLDGLNDIEGGLEELRAAADRAGRPFDELSVSVVIFEPTLQRVRELVELGVDRVVLSLPVDDPATENATLDRFAELAEAARKSAPASGG